jgi:hypothetical protein
MEEVIRKDEGEREKSLDAAQTTTATTPATSAAPTRENALRACDAPLVGEAVGTADCSAAETMLPFASVVVPDEEDPELEEGVLVEEATGAVEKMVKVKPPMTLASLLTSDEPSDELPLADPEAEEVT